MNNADWILLDTETTGLSAPIFVVELAAQRMCGWEPNGEPFRCLINQNTDIPPESSRVHGYTREILERDGDPAATVYREFSLYVGARPIVAYNLEYDLEEVLKPEWFRLGIAPIGTSGFCALKLAQRLLDPVPAGNCKLQTLRQFYRLPERGAHTALGDVQTVSDLMANVLRPIAERRGLKSWSDICAYTTSEWFPSRIAFGKFKGRNFRDARNDKALYGWLEWLAGSSNSRSASMGKWYLERIGRDEPIDADIPPFADAGSESGTGHPNQSFGGAGVVVYAHLDIELLRNMIAAARSRLAEIEVDYTKDRCAVESTQATLFNLVKVHYQRRDQLRLLVDYRRKYLKTLIASGDEEAEQVKTNYEQARSQTDSNYEDAAQSAANRRELSSEDERELKTLWKKLVRLYHPDLFSGEAETLATYEKLMKAINRAKEDADIELLREIASDPNEFILRQGWTTLNFNDIDEVVSLRKLLDTLQAEIIDKIEALDNLRESADYELYKLTSEQPKLLHEVAATRIKALSDEIAEFEAEAEGLRIEINELTGVDEHSVA